MALGRIRIDRFISQYLKVGRGNVRLILAQKRVHVDGVVLCDINSVIDTFSVVKLDGKTIQENTPYYVMLNKPAGVVSATESSIHKTVIELVKANRFLTHKQCNNLHIAGRLDFDSTGLVLLTNDSRWSSKLTAPESKITKKYRVTLDNIAEVHLTEGRYHQIKRMFGRFKNKVVGLNRFAIGQLLLDDNLSEGECRLLSANEVTRIFGGR